MTWQILQRQQSLSPMSTPSLRLQSCSRRLCRVHFLYGSSLATHQHSPQLTVSVSPNIMRRGKMRLYLLAFLRWNFLKENVKFGWMCPLSKGLCFFFPPSFSYTAAAAAAAAHRPEDKLSQSKSGLCSGAVLISPHSPATWGDPNTEVWGAVTSDKIRDQLHACLLPRCVRDTYTCVFVCASLTVRRLGQGGGGGGDSSCRDLPGDIGATAGDWAWHHRTRGVSQRSDHMGAGAFHIFTAYPARNSLSPGVGPLKRLPTEVPEPRLL